MSTRREQILAAVKAALLVAPPTAAGSHVFRSNPRPVPANVAISLNIVPDDDPARRFAEGLLDWALQFAVEIRVRGEEPDRVADPVVLDVQARLMGDASLAALVISLLPDGASFKFDDADTDLGITTLRYVARYRTTETDLTGALS